MMGEEVKCMEDWHFSRAITVTGRGLQMGGNVKRIVDEW
jgi:hypothetical protein